MTIPYNKNITKQLNSYVIVITLYGLLQRTKRAFNVINLKFCILSLQHAPNYL
jgi:hypothetical protein